MAEREVFERLLDGRPDDLQTRGVYADWLEENGWGLQGVCQRWMVREGKWPYYSATTERWMWQENDDVMQGLSARDQRLHRPMLLPTRVWMYIDGTKPPPAEYLGYRVVYKDSWVRTYESRALAEDALCRALHGAGVR